MQFTNSVITLASFASLKHLLTQASTNSPCVFVPVVPSFTLQAPSRQNLLFTTFIATCLLLSSLLASLLLLQHLPALQCHQLLRDALVQEGEMVVEMQYPPRRLQAEDAAQRLRLSASDRRDSETVQTPPEGPMSERKATPLVRRFEPEIAMRAGRHSKAADESRLDLIESLTTTFRTPANPHHPAACRTARYQPHRLKALAVPLLPKDLQSVRQAAQIYLASLG
jgi:hypothetical protein